MRPAQLLVLVLWSQRRRGKALWADGSWDSRFATVLAIGVSQRGAAVVVDSNSDGADVNVDTYRFDLGGQWRLGTSSNGTSGWSDGVAYISGRAQPGTEVVLTFQGNEWRVATAASGWWIFVVDMPSFDADALPKRFR